MASPAHPPSVICFGPFELDAANGELRKAGISLKIHPQPLRVLVLLAEQPRHIVTRDEIRSCLWGGNTFVDFEGGINSCMNQIRAVLGDDADKPNYIETLPRRGYRFIASVGIHVSTEPPVAGRGPKSSGLVYEWPLDREKSDSSTSSSEYEAARRPQIPTALRTWRRVAATVLGVAVAAGIADFAVHQWTSRAHGSNFENSAFHEAHGQWQG